MPWILVVSIILLSAIFYFYRNEIEVRAMVVKRPSKKGPRIGIVSSWARQGVPYQSRFLSKCLSAKHDIFVFAYKNYIKDELDWGYKNLIYSKIMKPWKVIDWIKKNDLKIIFFPDRLEDKNVLEWCKKNKVSTIMIINYETIQKREFGHYKLYSRLLCPVKCTADLLQEHGIKNSAFIRWGIDNDVFYPRSIKIKHPVMFIHNAGYGGTEWRKNTLAVVLAFDMASRKNGNIRLLIKSQRPIKEYPEEMQSVIKRNQNIIINDKNLKMSDLIKLCRSCHVSILPSKWEGIGIPFIESLAMGIPVITVDAPPMNEWVKDGGSGFCAKVARWEQRKDKTLLVKGAVVDVKDIAKYIVKLSDIKLIRKFSSNAARSTRESKREFTRKTEKLIRCLND